MKGQMDKLVRVKIPATTANLGPGFDCMGIALNLYNYVEIEEIKKGLIIQVKGDGEKSLETNEKNLVFTAANKIFRINNYNYTGLHICLYNNIPIARGLGSSAASIVGGMMAANNISNNILDFDTLMKLAVEMEGHPDNIVPAMTGGFAASVNNNDTIQYIKSEVPEKLRFIVCVPDFNLKTSDARKVLPEEIPLEDAIFNISRAVVLSSAIMKGDTNFFNLFGEDKLHQPYRSKLVPGIKQVMESAKKAGALGAFLSGAGPSIIAITKNDTEIIAQQMMKTFMEHGITSQIIISEASKTGAEVIVHGGKKS